MPDDNNKSSQPVVPNSQSNDDVSTIPTSEGVTPPVTPQDLINPPPSTVVTTQTTTTTSGSAAPVDDILLPTATSSPQKKYGGGMGKYVATILGLLLLIGGGAAGVLLVKQNQDVREKASSTTQAECEANLGNYKWCADGGALYGTNGTCCPENYSCLEVPGDNNDYCVGPGSGGTYVYPTCPTGQTLTCGTPPVIDCSRKGPCGALFPSKWTPLDNGCNNIPAGGQCQTNCSCNLPPTVPPTVPPTTPPTVPPTTPPTVPPTTPPSAQCNDVKAYDTNWVQLTAGQLSQLKPGDKVRFTVAGQASTGNFTKARFKVNGTTRAEVTAKKPGSNEFFDEYTIPTGTTSFSVVGDVYHETLGWK